MAVGGAGGLPGGLPGQDADPADTGGAGGASAFGPGGSSSLAVPNGTAGTAPGAGGGGANVTDMLTHQVEWDERFEDEVDELDKGRQGEPTSSGWVNPRKLEPEGHGQNVSADEMNSIEAQNHPDEVDGSGAKVIIPDTLGVSAINDPTFLDRFEYENRDDEDAAVRRLPNNRII